MLKAPIMKPSTTNCCDDCGWKKLIRPLREGEREGEEGKEGRSKMRTEGERLGARGIEHVNKSSRPPAKGNKGNNPEEKIRREGGRAGGKVGGREGRREGRREERRVPTPVPASLSMEEGRVSDNVKNQPADRTNVKSCANKHPEVGVARPNEESWEEGEEGPRDQGHKEEKEEGEENDGPGRFVDADVHFRLGVHP
jgi:hypothetical protein